MTTPAQPLTAQTPPAAVPPAQDPEFGKHTTATIHQRFLAKYPDAVANDGTKYADMSPDEFVGRLIQKSPVYQKWLNNDEIGRLAGGRVSDPGIWSGVKRFAGNVVKMPGQIYDAATKPYTPEETEFALRDPTMTPEQREQQRQNIKQDEQSTLGKLTAAPGKLFTRMIDRPGEAEQAKVAPTLNKAGGGWKSNVEAAGHELAAHVPLVGPIAANLGERAGAGDVSGAVTEGALTFGGPEIVKQAAKIAKPVVAPVLTRVAESAPVKATTNLAKRVVEPYGVGVSGEQLLKSGISPYAKQLGYDKAMSTLARDIVDYHKETPITSVRELDEALPKIQEKIEENDFKPAMERHAEETIAPERAARAKQAVLDSISDFADEFDPDAAEKARAFADKIGKVRTVGDLIGGNRGGLLGYINGKLESYFNKYPSARRADLMRNPDTAMYEAARRSLREETLSQLEEGGETGLRDARQRWGAAEQLSKSTERRVQQAERGKPMSIHRTLGLLATPATAGLSILVGELGHYLNKPDVLVKRGIARLAEQMKGQPNTRPASYTPPAPRAARPLLNAPATEAGWSEPDTSGPVRGGRWTTPAAQIGEGEPQTAKFIREIPRTKPAQPLSRPAGQLEETAASRRTPSTNIPPAVDEKFAREEVTPPEGAQPERNLGTTGRGGVRQAVKGQLTPPPEPVNWKGENTQLVDVNQAAAEPKQAPAVPITRPQAQQFPPVAETYTPEQIDEAKLMIGSELDAMESADKPGRYFDETETSAAGRAGMGGPKAGVRTGGVWRGLKSMRTMLPFMKEVSFTPAELRRALEKGSGTTYEQAITTARDVIDREQAAKGESFNTEDLEQKPARPIVYRAHTTGEPEVDLKAHAHATESREEAQQYAEHRNAGENQTVSRIDLNKWDPADYEEMEGPRGNKWYKFKRQLTREDLEPEEE